MRISYTTLKCGTYIINGIPAIAEVRGDMYTSLCLTLESSIHIYILTYYILSLGTEPVVAS